MRIHESEKGYSIIARRDNSRYFARFSHAPPVRVIRERLIPRFPLLRALRPFDFNFQPRGPLKASGIWKPMPLAANGAMTR
jgi:hypothetical protein